MRYDFVFMVEALIAVVAIVAAAVVAYQGDRHKNEQMRSERLCNEVNTWMQIADGYKSLLVMQPTDDPPESEDEGEEEESDG